MDPNKTERRFGTGARLVCNLSIIACLLAVAAGCSGGSSDSADGQGGPLDGDAPSDSDDQPSPSTSSTTTTTTTTTSPPLTLQDLADRLTAEIASGECSTAEQLADDFSLDLVSAAGEGHAGFPSPGLDGQTICERLAKVDDWLSVNDQRLRVTSNAPVECDGGRGEVSLEAFPALFEAVDRIDIVCLAVGQNDGGLTYQTRGSFEALGQPSPAFSKTTEAETELWIGDDTYRFSCYLKTRLLAIGGIYFAYSDLRECPFAQGFGNAEWGSPAPVAALVSCVEECGDDPAVSWFASDGFIWDQGWVPSEPIDTSELDAELDLALSMLDARLFVYGRFDGPLADASMVSSMAILLNNEGQLNSAGSLMYNPRLLTNTALLPTQFTEWDALPAYRGSNSSSDQGFFGDCADWNIDQIERGFGGQPCVKALLEVFQFDQNTGFCTFLAEIPESGDNQYSTRTDELVWVDGFTPNVSGSCLVDPKVDNDDLALGHLVPNGTHTYFNGVGAEVTVPKLTALRVIEYRDQ